MGRVIKLYVPYNNIFRMLSHEPKWASTMFVTRHQPVCEMLTRKHVDNFIVRIERSNNVIIRNILSYDTPFRNNVAI